MKSFVAMLMAVSISAHAHVFTQPECRKAAASVMAVAEAKGDGAPSTVVADVMRLLAESKGEKGSFIKDAEDLELMQHAFTAVYSRDITPGNAYDEFFFPCSRTYLDKGGS